MITVELVPNLESCIETTARREHRKAMARLLSAADDEELGQRVETLAAFLESADFARLRSESEKHLVAGKRVRFLVRLLLPLVPSLDSPSPSLIPHRLPLLPP